MITFETYKPGSKVYTRDFKDDIKSKMVNIRDVLKASLLNNTNYQNFECFNLNADTLMLIVNIHVGLGNIIHQFAISANWYKETVIIKHTNTDNADVNEVTVPFSDLSDASEIVRDYFVEKITK